ncbi:MAG: flagellar basal body P-ring formation chaperone FlgA [Pirellulales bacterium]
MKRFFQQLALLLVAGCLAAPVAVAAEIRLKPQAKCRGNVVMLGEVADVFAADEFQREQLLAVELGPAPLAGNRRLVRVREVQDALWMRGINLSQHQFSGSEIAEIAGGSEVSPVAGPSLTAASRDRAVKMAVDAVVHALQESAGNRDPFQVRVSLNDVQATAVLNCGQRVLAHGGVAPFTGAQQMTLTADDGQTVCEITAEVALPPGVVVVQKSLPAGSIVHPGDLVLKPITSVNPGIQPFHSIEEVAGMQTTWSIPAGTILSRTGVQRPQVVRRGDAVTLYARTAGIRVRTTVRARESGGIGDLITVESLTDRAPLFVRITGVQEAEVYADPAGAQAPVPATAAQVATDKFRAPAGGLVR